MICFLNKPIITFTLATVMVTLLLGLNGCHTKKVVQSTEPELSSTALYKELTSNTMEWTSVEVPFSITLTDPTRISLTGRARFERDKSMELSLRMLGIEVARMLIRTDSIFALYRLDKIYLAEDITAISSVLPVNLDNIQDLLIGRPFFLSGTSMTASDIKGVNLGEVSDSISIVPKRQLPGLIYAFTAAQKPQISLTGFALDAPGAKVRVNAKYAPFQSMTPAGTLAETTSIDVISKKFSIAARLTWKWKSAKWNAPLDIIWQTPANYKRVTAESLMKSLHQ